MVETGGARDILERPGDPYTQALIAASPRLSESAPDLPNIGAPLLEASRISVSFPRAGWRHGSFTAVEDAVVEERGDDPPPDVVATAVREGALLRVRPKAMTVAVIIAGLLPILVGSGAGSEVMSRIVAPMVGGMLTAPLLSMFVIPAAYLLMRRRKTRSISETILP